MGSSGKKSKYVPISFAACMLIGIVGLACGSGGGGEPTAEPEDWEAPLAMTDSGYESVTDSMKRGVVGGGDQNVAIEGMNHEDLSILVGTVVKWENKDSVSHTATSGTPDVPDGIWDTGEIEPESDAKFLFSEPGVFQYHCTIHPEMTGTVTVSEIE